MSENSNYPPGVTGREYAIAGPDYEREVRPYEGISCPVCNSVESIMEIGYNGEAWYCCSEEGCEGGQNPFGDHYIEQEPPWDTIREKEEYQ